jgi:hypothetical protein
MLRRTIAAIFNVAVALAAGGALAQTLVTGSVIASGGGTSKSPGGCRVLESTLAEPVGGRTSGGAFAIDAGYWAGVGSRRRDKVFGTGFEECN